MDSEQAIRLLELNEELCNRFIQVAGGPGELAILIAEALELKVKTKDAATAFGIGVSGSRKRLKKIKGKQVPKSDPELTQKKPKVTRKRPSRKKPL